MKKIICTSAALVLMNVLTFAQKLGYIESQTVLEKMPEYTTAQQQLDALAKKWQDELDGKYKMIDSLYRAYQQEELLLTEDLKKKRQDEIARKEKEAKDFQKQKFGYNGELFTSREEKIKPLQDKIYEAIQQVAQERDLDFILDKSGSLVILYSNPKYDITDAVMEKLGLNIK